MNYAKNVNTENSLREYDALKYPCNECDRTDCEEREDYSGEENK